MLNMQNVKDIEITEGDVRTIHDKDSRLIWGRLAYDTKYAGDTYQQTYSGKNLYDMSVNNRVSWSEYLSEDESGWITATGYNGFYNFWTRPNMNLVAGATYYYVLEVKEVYAANASDHIMICNGTSTASASKPQFVDDADLKYTDLQAGGVYVGSITASSDFSNANNMLRSWCRPYNASSKIVFRLTIMSTQPSASTFVFEPYTGGIPAPNPDYPEPINVVTGVQNVLVHGKNLFNVGATLENRYLNADGGWTAGYSFVNQEYNVGNNTALTVSFTSRVGSSYVRVGMYKADGSFIERALVSTNSTVNLSAGTSKIVTSVDNVSNAKFNDLQIEFGSSASSYESYQSATYTIDLGATELCKIGTYQDYIYKSGDDWYVHKALKKITFSGDISETWVYNSGSAYPFRYNLADADQLAESQAYAPNVVVNYYTPFAWNISTRPDYGVTAATVDRNLCFRNVDMTSLDAWKTWLASHNTITYYPLATPTDTKITDAALVGQLNAVHEWLTRYGYSSTVTGNLPIIINQTNL